MWGHDQSVPASEALKKAGLRGQQDSKAGDHSRIIPLYRLTEESGS